MYFVCVSVWALLRRALVEISNDSPLSFTDTDTDLTDNEIAAAIEFYGSDTDDPGLLLTSMLMLMALVVPCSAFGTGTAGAAADRMTIQVDGKVGIETRRPRKCWM